MTSEVSLSEMKNVNKRLLSYPNRKKALHHAKFNVVMSHEDCTKIMEHRGFQVIYNPPGDGNCQFAALAH